VILPFQKLIKNIAPLSKELRDFVADSREQIKLCLHGKKKSLVIGPCSMSGKPDFIEYADLLSREKQDSFFVLRAFFEKPRTSLGWTGFLNEDVTSIEERILDIRRILMRCLAFGLPLATEFVNPLWADYFLDCISWVFVGARTVTSQLHRQFASSLNVPCGFKNDLSGNPKTALDAVCVANASHSITEYADDKIILTKSSGNANTHIVLRGSDTSPNDDLCQTLCTRVLIDCSHGNGKWDGQIAVAKRILDKKYKNCFGWMLESFLHSGSDNNPKYGQSKTDPCLNWNETKDIIDLFREWESSNE